MRHLFFLLWLPGLLLSQNLPSYLSDTFPSANTKDVPTNVNIILRTRTYLPSPPFSGTGYYTLKSQAGA
ncbi:MAG TPA: hypothetical protein VKE70_37355, partial [Candidatus Solibacter sp.]|nr:hypothetical protein [Candidatus Solibacter sp.]